MITNSNILIKDRILFQKQAPGTTQRYQLRLTENGMGYPVLLPIFVARGVEPGPVIGFTAAVHGNELNGVKVLHNLIREIERDVDILAGTVVAVPVVNIPGLLSNSREFNNGTDLNRIMPGKASGNSSDQYSWRFIKHVVSQFDYMIDLHTASFGRVNSLYVRADLDNPVSRRFAMLQHPQIIVHNKGKDKSLRGAAAKMGIPAITVEVGDPQRFQKKLIKYSLVGVHNILSHLKMLPMEQQHSNQEPIICQKSYWVYTDRGGFLEVYPQVTQRVQKGEIIARISDIFGTVKKEYIAPEEGVIIGKSVNPVSQTGARIIHLGIE
jgi:uncharacterized protein